MVSLVTEARRVQEQSEATGPTTADTFDRLRSEGASVAEFVAAGGLSSFRPLTTYYVAEVVNGRPIQSFDAAQMFDDLGDAIAHARALSQFGPHGVFELVFKAVFS